MMGKEHGTPRPLNSYNLFFILERQLLLQSNGIVEPCNHLPSSALSLSSDIATADYDNYKDLATQFPPMPSKYRCLDLPVDWFMHGKNKQKTRAHSRSHGIISFRDMAKMMATNWKKVDDEVLNFVSSVADMIVQRRDELQYAELLRSYQADADDYFVSEEFPSAMLCREIQPTIREVDMCTDEIIAMWSGGSLLVSVSLGCKDCVSSSGST